MSKKRTVKEDAAGGSVGAGAIAVAAPRLGDMRKRGSLKHYLTTFYKGLRNKVAFKPVQMGTLKEFYDLSDIVSRLKGAERAGTGDEDDTTTFGIEDDNGNVMKISIKKDQAKDFEYKLARDLAEFKEDKMSGTKAGLTLAELLFNLKDEFDIVDVEFPEIPKDVIYNADKATKAPVEDAANDMIPDNTKNSNAQMGDDMDMGDGSGGEMGEEGLGDEMGGEDENMGDDSDVTLDDINGEGEDSDLDSGDEDDTTDDESVEDFGDEKAPASPESLLQSVMDMLKADADAKKAQADAAAEEARAKQAEYSYKSTQATVSHQEELAQMEADMDEQKDKEKEAKKIANLAKHRVSKMSAVGESFLGQIVMELVDTDTIDSLNRQRNELSKQWAVLPNDVPDVAIYKKKRLQAAMKEIDAKITGIKLKAQFLAGQKAKTAAQPQAQAQPQQAVGQGNAEGTPQA